MEKITLTLNNGTEMELSTYIWTDTELRPYVTSYEDALNKLAYLTRENLSSYAVKYGDETVMSKTGMEVASVRFPLLYEKVEETDEIIMTVNLRKAIGEENE